MILKDIPIVSQKESMENLKLLLIIGKEHRLVSGLGPLWPTFSSQQASHSAKAACWWENFEELNSESASEILEFAITHGRSIDLVLKTSWNPLEETGATNLRVYFQNRDSVTILMAFSASGEAEAPAPLCVFELWDKFPHPAFGIDSTKSEPTICAWNEGAERFWKKTKAEVLGNPLAQFIAASECSHLKILLADASLHEAECVCESDLFESINEGASENESSATCTKILRRLALTDPNAKEHQFIWVEQTTRQESSDSAKPDLGLQAQALGIVHWNLNLFKEFQLDPATPESIQANFNSLLDKEPKLLEFVNSINENELRTQTAPSSQKIVLSSGRIVRVWTQGLGGFFAGLPLNTPQENTASQDQLTAA